MAKIQLKQTALADVGTVEAGKIALFIGDDGKVYKKDSDGNVTQIANYGEIPTDINQLADEDTLLKMENDIFDDWFLPSRDELSAIYTNIHLEGLGGFSETNYWSSHEKSVEDAHVIVFSDGSLAFATKTSLYKVRPARKFTSDIIYNIKDIGPAGGYIFYIDVSDPETPIYYEVASSDLADSAWSNIIDSLVGTEVEIGEGETNTDAIIAQEGHTASAAKLCNDYVVDLDLIKPKESKKIHVRHIEGAFKYTTHSDLKALRDSRNLIPGQQYRIIDYEFTTTQENTQSAGNVFDIIVIADDASTLNENARAVQHQGDTYFANANLAAWKLKYSIDNDYTKFAWADPVDGKGVIYQMIDEWDNDLPYDFKNAQILDRVSLSYSYTFDSGTGVSDAVISGSNVNNNKIKAYYDGAFNSGDAAGIKQFINMNVFQTCVVVANNTMSSFCRDNIFTNCSKIHSNLFGADVISNTINAEGFKYNKIGDVFSGNTIGSGFANNSVNSNFINNTVGYSCVGNSFGNNAVNLIIGNGFANNTLKEDTMECVFGDGFNHNTINNGLYKITFGDTCLYNTCGNRINNSGTNKIVTFGDNLIGCKIEDFAFASLAADLDLSAATLIRGAYNKTIYQDATLGVRLSYISNNVLTFAAVTD